MKTSLKHRLILIGLFSVFSILMEMICFGILGFGVLPEYFLLDIGVILIIDALLLILPNARFVSFTSCFFLLIQAVISYINITMYDVYGDLFSVNFLTLTHEAIEAVEPNMLSLGKGIVLLSCFILFVLLISGIYRRFIKENKYSLKKYASVFVPISLLFSLLGNLTLNAQQKNFDAATESYYYTQNIMYRFSSLNIKSESLKSFGTWGFYFKELKNVYLTKGKINESTIESITEAMRAMKAYDNDYSSLLKGKNVITIMLESTQAYAINEVLTPNLYMIMNEGLNMTNNVSRNKTNVSEFIGISGSYPLAKQLYASEDYYLPFTISNILKEEGYITNYVHENTKDYYQRAILMPKSGFDNSYFYNDYYNIKDYQWGIWPTDSQFVEDAINDLIPSATEKFYTFWTTLTTHGPYQDQPYLDNIFEELGYYDKIDAYSEWTNYLEGTEKEENYRYYQAAVMDLDAAIGLVLDALEEKGILDDTLLVLYGDHQVYYDQIYMTVDGKENNDFSYSSLYKTPLFIYNSLLSNRYKTLNGTTQISKFSSTYNIVPTILDLLGAKYLPSLYLGTSIFYDEDDYMEKNVFVSLQGGIFNDLVFTLNGYDITSSTNEDYEKDLEDLRIASNYFFSKMDYIEKVYNNDLFEDIIDYDSLFED